MKYIITESQLSKFVRRYLDSLDLRVVTNNDEEIWIENGHSAVFWYYIDGHQRQLNIDPDIWSTVRNMFDLEDYAARMEIVYWFEDKFNRRIDDVKIWWD